MRANKYLVLHVALAVITSTTLLIGCATRKDAISQAERTEKTRPSIAETKAIAEEGFIYGLPIVMNYAVMYEYAADKKSSQFKAPFNDIYNMHHVATYEDTAIITPNSDTPYSILWLDLRAEPMVISVPAVPKQRYYSVQLTDGNTYNYGYIGTRSTGTEAGKYLVVGPDWKGKTPAGIKKVFTSTTPFSIAVFRTQLFNPKDMPNVEKVQAGYRAKPLSAFLKQPAPPVRRKSISSRPAARESRTTSSSTSTLPSSSSHRRRRARMSGPDSPGSASARARALSSRISRWNIRPLLCWA
jgi:hypothetical protein